MSRTVTRVQILRVYIDATGLKKKKKGAHETADQPDTSSDFGV